MKVALVVNSITNDINSNISRIKSALAKAVNNKADIVLFSEAAFTGLINNDDPAHDLPLGQEIPGTGTDELGNLSKNLGIWIAIGLLERDKNKLYDSAVLIDPGGEIRLKYRRIQPQWHGREAAPHIYCQGSELEKVQTPFGSFAFLICGDLFDDDIIRRVRVLKPDWLLFPFARCFDDERAPQARWDREEQQQYINRVKMTGITTFMTNYLASKDMNGGAFGGAFVIGAEGNIVSSFPLSKEGILYNKL